MGKVKENKHNGCCRKAVSLKRLCRKKEFKCAVILFLFPLLVGVFYSLPLPQYIAVDCGDLLSYYATAFGLFGSIYIFLQENKNRKKEHESQLAPALHVSLRKEQDVYKLRIAFLKEQTLSEVILYDQMLCEKVSGKQIIEKMIYFGKKGSIGKGNSVDFVFSDSGLFAEDEKLYPDYIQIVCCDVEHNCWVCDFRRIKFDGGYEYLAEAPRIES